MGSVYRLTLRQLASKGRLAIMLVLAAMPVLSGVMNVNRPHSTAVGEFEDVILGTLLTGAIGPLIVLATAAAAFGNEIEDGTLVNLTLSSLSRWKIAIPKLLATLTIAVPIITLSAWLTSYIAFTGDPRATMAVTLAVAVGVVMYASVFVWLGLVSPQAIGIGLLYIVVWEGFASGFVAGVRVISIRQYAIALMHGLDERRFATGIHYGLSTVLTFAAVVVVGFLLLTIRRLRRMDVP